MNPGKPDQRASTIYMSAETAARARAIEKRTGTKSGRLIREFLENYSRLLELGMPASISAATFVMPAVAPWKVESAVPFRGDSDKFRSVDIWQGILDHLDPLPPRIFLMGRTLVHPITNHEEQCRRYIRLGGVLHILLQGDLAAGIEDDERIVAASNSPLNRLKLGSREKTFGVLARLLDGAEPDQIVVRNSGQMWIMNNLGIVFRRDGLLDVVLEVRYSETGHYRSINVVLTARQNPADPLYELVVRPIEDCWLTSIPEYRISAQTAGHTA
ncbi:MAG: hypothetical protein HY678_07825 [Chloroflexi bacterium]|nr:hypothetical protein [Chloroflexota bacterium]